MASIAPDLTSKRRRFQAPITNFFPAHPTHPDGATSFSHTHTHYSAPTSSPTPIVSAKEQASLLNVGMRIRKAVPEGYKTKPVNKSAGVYNSAGANCPELAPFCAMAKPGDRPVGSLEDPSSCITTDDGDAFSLPPSSQDSALSSSSTTTGLKRPCDSDVVSNESSELHLDDADSIPAARQILAPSLSRQRQVLAAAQSEVSSAVPPGGLMELDDFEEAGFLQRREDVD